MTAILPSELGPLVTAGAEALLDQGPHPDAGPEMTAYGQAVVVISAVLDHPDAGELLGVDLDSPVPFSLTCLGYAAIGRPHPAAQRPVDEFRNTGTSNGARQPSTAASGRISA